MNTRDTSIEAYNKIREGGLLPARRWEAYDILYRHGPLTANEMMFIAKEEDAGRTHQYLESIGRRLSELRDQGAIREIGSRVCSQTGMRCLLWDVTSKIPDPLPKKKASKQIIAEQASYILVLEAENRRLKDELARQRSFDF